MTQESRTSINQFTAIEVVEKMYAVCDCQGRADVYVRATHEQRSGMLAMLPTGYKLDLNNDGTVLLEETSIAVATAVEMTRNPGEIKNLDPVQLAEKTRMNIAQMKADQYLNASLAIRSQMLAPLAGMNMDLTGDGVTTSQEKAAVYATAIMKAGVGGDMKSLNHNDLVVEATTYLQGIDKACKAQKLSFP